MTDEIENIKKEVKAQKNVHLRLHPEEYIKHIKEVTYLTKEEEGFLKKKYGVK